jgi:hypothetical protein
LIMSRKTPETIALTTDRNEAKYTEQDLQKALQDQRERLASVVVPRIEKEVVSPSSKPSKLTISRPVNHPTQWARRSLSKSEREQLAADLRLLSTTDEDNLSLIGEKINQEF